MQKVSRSIRMIAFLLALIMMTFAYTGVTLSRYVTAVSGSDFARVAIWGINSDKSVMDLFSSEYDLSGKLIMKSNDGDKLIGPGVGRSSAFTIINYEKNIAPEVAYQVKFDIDDSEIDDAIKNNKSIQWKLDDAEWGTWDNLKTNILSLSGNKNGVQVYGPGQFMDAFKNNEYHIISWRWLMDNNNNEEDTLIGNAALKGDIVAKVSVKITAEQIDGYGIGILEGNNQIVDLNNLAPAVFRSAAPKSEFKGVTVNNVTLSSDKYSVSEGSTVIALKEEYLKTLKPGDHVLNIISESMTAIARFSVVDTGESDEDGNVIPSGGTYYIGVTSDELGNYNGYTKKLVAGDEFPETVNQGDVYVYGDYEYRYGMSRKNSNEGYSFLNSWGKALSGWGVMVLDDTKSTYDDILPTINNKNILSLNGTFADCKNLKVSPKIPDTVYTMVLTFYNCEKLVTITNLPKNINSLEYTFLDCVSLKEVPRIPDGVERLDGTFYNCISLENIEYIPSSVQFISYLFYNCTSLTGTIELPINYSVAQNSYDVFVGTIKPITITGPYLYLKDFLNYGPHMTFDLRNAEFNLYNLFTYDFLTDDYFGYYFEDFVADSEFSIWGEYASTAFSYGWNFEVTSEGYIKFENYGYIMSEENNFNSRVMYDDIIDQSTYYVYHCNDQSIVSRIIENKFTQCYSNSTWEYWFNSAFNYDFGSWRGYKIIDSNIVSPNGEKLRYGDGTLVNIYDIFEEDLENSLYFSN